MVSECTDADGGGVADDAAASRNTIAPLFSPTQSRHPLFPPFSLFPHLAIILWRSVFNVGR